MGHSPGQSCVQPSLLVAQQHTLISHSCRGGVPVDSVYVRTLFLACRWSLSHCDLQGQSSLSFFLKEPWSHGGTSLPLQDLPSKYHPTVGEGFNSWIWGGHKHRAPNSLLGHTSAFLENQLCLRNKMIIWRDVPRRLVLSG